MRAQFIQQKIFEIREQKVMLDFDLGALYEVETRVFNQAVRTNIESIPEDFMSRLTRKEWSSMRSQIVTSYIQIDDSQNVKLITNCDRFTEKEKKGLIALRIY